MLWQAQLASAESSIGVGLLGVALSLRWAVGRWETAKRDWWQGWTRVCQGLERDLKVLPYPFIADSLFTSVAGSVRAYNGAGCSSCSEGGG
jgi:hypothetical protein